MSSDDTACTTTLLCSELDADPDANAETAVTQFVVDAHPDGAQGESHDLLMPVDSHGPEGIPEVASLIAATFEACAACIPAWLVCDVRATAGALMPLA